MCLATESDFSNFCLWLHPDEELVDVVTRDVPNITLTKLIENAVRTERVAETNKGFNKDLSRQKSWDEFNDSKVEH